MQRVVFVFSGYGSQWNGMRRALLAEEPVFRETFERCAAAIHRASGLSLADCDDALERRGVDVIQPLLFAMQLSLAALWRSWGIAPSAVVGHSLGEITAACDAGALTLDDAAKIVCVYSELQQTTAGRGAMALIEKSRARIEPELSRYPGVVVAAVNGPETVLVSGAPEHVAALVAEHVAAGVFARTIDITVAAHGPQIDAIAPELDARLASIVALPGAVPIYSTVTRGRLPGDAFGGAYWAKNLRSPVLFQETLKRLLDDGHDRFIEVSPHPVLVSSIEATIRDEEATAVATQTLRRGEGDRASMLRAVARLRANADARTTPPTKGDPARRSDRRVSIDREVRDEVATLLGVESASVAMDATFVDLGLDSQRALDLARRLKARFQIALPTTIVWTCPTVAALALDVARRFDGHAPSALEATREVAGERAPSLVDPIAIVGMACRFPGGADTPEDYWTLLREGRCATRETPKDRWDLDAYIAQHPESAPMRFGGFLDRVDLFEPEAFGISPREAAWMDPQQRLWLEVSWEALENAGLPFDRIAGTKTGLFVGSCSGDYARVQPSDLGEVDTYTWMGASNNMLAGRVAYLFDLRGPALVVDTACSSSLVAVHLACESLRRGESDVALAGGVNLILSPVCSTSGAKMNLFAADGRCKTFDASADGMVRAEGCGAIVLKRLSDATRAGDRVFAVIRGTAVNQDGRSNGLTAPNGEAQRALVRQALANAGVAPADIGYVEAHGTATPLGDPIELGALADVFAGRSALDGPCAVASAKTNLGHLEGAAGIAGLMKVVLSLEHATIAPHLHFRTLNPHASLEGTPFVIPLEATPWPSGEKPRRAGVSSFGWSGTNAHVVLEEAPATAPLAAGVDLAAPLDTLAGRDVPDGARGVIVPISAHSLGSLRDLATAYASALRSNDGPAIDDVAYTAAARRGHRSFRLAVVGASRCELADGIESALRERLGADAAAPQRGPVAFVFSGHGSQWRGMGRDLFARDDVFRASIERCDEALKRAGSRGVVGLLCGDHAESTLKRVDVIHPFLFAMHVSIAALLASRGLTPDAVVGHSLGEVAAAHVAGALTLDDAARIIWERSRLVHTTSGRGAMALAELSVHDAEDLVKDLRGAVVAAENAPDTVLLSGDAAAIGEALARLEARGVFCRALDIDIASHGPQMGALLEPLATALSGVRATAPRVPIFSTVSASVTEAFDAPYWARNLRGRVRFHATIAKMLDEGYATFVEVSPHPVLTPSMERIFVQRAATSAAISTMRRNEPEERGALDAIARVYEAGGTIDWNRHHTAPSARRSGRGRIVDLPAYRWRRERYWIERSGATAGTGLAASRTGHSVFTHASLSSLDGTTRFWNGEIRLDGSPWGDHRVRNAPFLPAAVHVEAALHAARVAFDGDVELADLSFESPLQLPTIGATAIQLAWSEAEPGRATFHLASRATDASGADDVRTNHDERGGAFTVHARGVARAVAGPMVAPNVEPAQAIVARCQSVDVAALYTALDRRGVAYGPRFRGITRLFSGAHGAGEAWAELDAGSTSASTSAASGDGGIDPVLLDVGFQVLVAALAGAEGAVAAYLPMAIESVRSWGRPTGKAFAHATVRAAGGDVASGDIVLRSDDGRVLLEIRGLFLQRLAEPKDDVARWLFDVRWERAERLGASAPGRHDEATASPELILFADESGVAQRLGEHLARAGHPAVIVSKRSSVADYVAALESVAKRDDSRLAGVVHLSGLDAIAIDSTNPLGAAREDGVHSALHLVQALARAELRATPRLFVVTRGAQPVAGDRVIVAQSPLWGMGRVFPHEHPELRPVQIDLGSAPTGDEIESLARELVADSDGDEDQVAFRDVERFVARMAPSLVLDRDAERTRASTGGVSLRGDASYLITGGMGGLGIVLARFFAARGARHLILMGRSAPGDEAAAAIDELRAAGVEVIVARGDVARAEDVARVLRRDHESVAPIAGIVHAAMTLDDGVILQQTAERFDRVLGAKALGALHLHEQTRGLPLDFFVLFSSVASVMGLAGQSNYAAGNAFLDALAHARRAEGLPALSINWGPWSEVGAAAGQANRGERLSGQGMLGLSPDEGVRAFDALLANGEHAGAQVTVLKIHPRTWRQRNRRVAALPFFTALLQGQVGDGPATEGAIRRELAALPASHREGRLERYVAGLLAQIVRTPASKVDRDTPIGALGFDSLMALELRNRLETALDLFLPSSLLWTHRTVGELARNLGERMDLPVDARAANVMRTAHVPPIAMPVTGVRAETAEPIAIVGMACRFPGADDPEAFWALLAEGRDAVVEVPKDRWDIDRYYDADPMAAGKMSSRWGGFIGNVDGFDADFFGIPAREAKGLDPQQRVLLEVAWEALENAGQPPPKLRGTQTGVFVGICYEDYRALMEEHGAANDAYVLTGNVQSFAAGRISYAFDLQGPSVVVNTACSSSLVAVDLACKSLRAGVSDVALAAAVNLMLSPQTTVLTSKLFALSPAGRCKTFDASASGIVRGEGCGVVVLKRLSDARAAGDRVLAVILSSAVNQDGQSAGLTAPNVSSQRALLARAIREAGVRADDVSYVEAHGTGTALGDPIEVEALKAVLGAPRPAGDVCALASVKTNIGHLESAAGMAGLIKAVLALDHEVIPKHLHFTELNPNISFDGTPFVVPTEALAWPRGVRRRVAGVSSFGLSGTNAHVIVSDPPDAIEPRSASRPSADRAAAASPLVLSARTPPALRALASRFAAHLAIPTTDTNFDIGAVCRAAAVRRAHHACRLFVTAPSGAELVESLRAFAAADGDATDASPIDGLWSGESSGARCVTFVFSGQGSQWLGMGRGSMAHEPAFRASMEACDAAFRRILGWSIVDALARDDGRRAEPAEPENGIERVDIVQPLLFSMQVSVAAVLRAWGVEPSAVVGHSLGEVSAAHVAGALSLDDAALVIATRSKLIESTAGRGAMALIELPHDDTALSLDRYPGVSVAAINGPESVLVSGEPLAIDALVADLSARDVFARKLHIAVAAHGPQMDPLQRALRDALAPVRPTVASVPLYSTVTGAPIPGQELDAAYWARNLREPVLFHRTLERLVDDGHDTFIEISPHPVLLPSIEKNLARHAGTAALPSLVRDRDERACLSAALGRLYTMGAAIAWSSMFGDAPMVDLPTYPFQHTRYWFDEPARGSRPSLATRARADAPFLGDTFQPAAEDGARYWETRIGVERFPYLADHRVQGSVIFPASGYVEMVLEAAGEATGGAAFDLVDVAFERMLVVPNEGDVAVQIALRPEGAARWGFQIFGREADDSAAPWREHARGTVVTRDATETDPIGTPRATGAELPSTAHARCTETVATDDFYRTMEGLGLEYGPAFRGLSRIHRRDGEAIADVRFDPPAGHRVHPAFLDACFQALGSSLRGSAYLPVSIGRIRVHAAPRGAARSHFLRSSTADDGADVVRGDIRITDEHGAPLIEISALSVRRVAKGREPTDDLLYESHWQNAARLDPIARGSLASRRFVIVDRTGSALAGQLRALIEENGGTCSVVERLVRDALTDGRAPGTAVVHIADGARASNGHDGGRGRGALDIEESSVSEYTEALHTVQATANAGHRDPPRLYGVTRGAQACGGSPLAGLATSVLWGFARTVAHEHPELRASMIDLDPNGHDAEARMLLDEIASSGDETEIAFRGDARRVARLRRFAGPPPPGEERRAVAAGRPFRLEIRDPGRLDDLVLRATHARRPGPGQIAIDVAAAALNFVDVLRAMGVYPGAQAGETPLGGECSGRVVAIGGGVTGFAVGDPVVAIATHAMGTYVVADARLVAPKPASLSFEQAASLPLTFITSLQALSVLGRVSRGDRVLIHSATGGMGLTGIQIARRAGAEVLATAGTEAKRTYLRSIGIEHVMDSRSLDFAREVMEATGGRGVDVVMNSLTGEAIAKGLSVLAPYGRFIEIGKKDIYDNTKLGLFQLRQNAVYATVDLVALLRDRPTIVGDMLRAVVRGIEDGSLAPLPIATFGAADAQDAFRTMARAEHIGKIVVSFADRDVAIAPPSAPAPIDPEGSYLVAGGLGGLGLVVARRLVERGARHVVLMGRSAPSGDAERAIAALRGSGADIRAERGDVANPADVARVVSTIAETGRALRGIVHSAVVLDDGVILKQTAARFAGVMRPKVLGAWNLHASSLGAPLDFFVLFSSAASSLGSAGQANYSASNAFLDALAHHRAALGLPAVSIGWGPWADVGQASAAANRGERLAGQGMRSLAQEEALRVFERVLHGETPHVTAVALDFRQWRESNRRTADLPLFALLRAEVDGAGRGVSTAAGGPSRDAFHADLVASPPRKRRELLESLVAREAAQVLRIPARNLHASTAFGPLGVDSLMSLELRNRLEGALGVKLPTTLLWNFKTVGALAAHLAEKMALRLDEPVAEAAAPVVSSGVEGRLAAIEALSDEDAEAALLAKLDADYAGSADE